MQKPMQSKEISYDIMDILLIKFLAVGYRGMR